MDYHKLLEQEAEQLQLTLTPLADLHLCEHAQKVACCGGVVTRIVSESACDTTIALRDGSSTCFCAVHGDVANVYPDVLTVGALLVLRNVTLLVTGAKMPPLLIACLDNLVGLLLPEDEAAAPAAPPLPPPPPELRSSPLRLRHTHASSSLSLSMQSSPSPAAAAATVTRTATAATSSAWPTLTQQTPPQEDEADVYEASWAAAAAAATTPTLRAQGSEDTSLSPWQRGLSMHAYNNNSKGDNSATAAAATTTTTWPHTHANTTTPQAQRVRATQQHEQQPPPPLLHEHAVPYAPLCADSIAHNADVGNDDDDDGDCLELADDA